MESKFIISPDGTLHYHKYGEGKHAILIFHGAGQTSQAFQFLARLPLASQYTFYFFDLFFHGASTWKNDDTLLGMERWKDFITQFLKQECITQFQLLGYSMGGKFALATFYGFPDRTQRLVLLAPDGVNVHPWYWLATGFSPTRALFKSMILNHARFARLITWANRLRLTNASVARFVTAQMATEAQRRQIYFSWVVFRPLKINPKTLLALAKNHQTPISIVTGKHDKLLPPSAIKSLGQKLPAGSFIIANTGHQGLIQESANLL